MSLLTCASPWDSNDIAKKRIPTMRKTQKKLPSLEINTEELEEEDRPSSFEEDKSFNEDQNDRVTKLIDNMSSVLEENDGNKLANFNPIDLPEIQKKTDLESSAYGRNGDEPLGPIPNHLQQQAPTIQQITSNFGPSEQDLGIYKENKPYSNYQRVYEPTRVKVPMQYNELQTQPVIDNKLLEKINYMIYMLEQQQNEKTSNITEEFILYTFLGVFIIFIVDSFARSGKYIR